MCLGLMPMAVHTVTDSNDCWRRGRPGKSRSGGASPYLSRASRFNIVAPKEKAATGAIAITKAQRPRPTRPEDVALVGYKNNISARE
jgi:hypothetical protein